MKKIVASLFTASALLFPPAFLVTSAETQDTAGQINGQPLPSAGQSPLLRVEGYLDSHPLDQDEVNHYGRILALMEGKAASPLDDALRQRATEELILFYHVQRTRALQHVPTASEVSETLDNLKAAAGQHYATAAEWQQAMTAAGLTDADLWKYAFHRQYVHKVLALTISPSRIQSYYDANRPSFTLATVSHILVRSEEEADEILKRLHGGASFATLAKKYSLDPDSWEDGGRYEEMPVSSWVPEFQRAVLALKVGKISPPVHTRFGYHIIQVEERRVLPLAEAEPLIREQLMARTRQALLEEALKRYRTS